MIQSEAVARDRRAMMRAAAALIFAMIALDAILLESVLPETGVIRIAWAGGLLILATIAPRLEARALDRCLATVALATTVAWVLTTLMTGGIESPYFYSMVAAPLLFGVLAPDNLHAGTASGISTILGNLPVLWLEEAPFAAYAAWLLISIFFSLLATLGVVAFRRLRVAEREQERVHAQSLAVSEKRRFEAEKLALLGRLSAGVAHEVNNPLAFIKSNLDFLIDVLSDPRTQTHPTELSPLLDDCKLGIARIEEIVASLASYAQRDEFGAELCDLASVVEEAKKFASVRIRFVADIQVRIPPGLPPVLANRTRLVQVIVNLLINAADAIAEGGRGHGTVEFEARLGDSRLEFLVCDDGPGVPPELRASIFEPFFTTKPRGSGTGLGLSLAREFLQSFDASIEASERPGGGACFRISFPAPNSGVAAA